MAESDSAGSDSAGWDSAGSDSAGSDSAGSDSAGLDSAGSNSARVQDSDPFRQKSWVHHVGLESRQCSCLSTGKSISDRNAKS